ncbi:MAG: hypothetical protein Q7S12_03900 [bacterium]|nr:hypothetical protein [bacterium]
MGFFAEAPKWKIRRPHKNLHAVHEGWETFEDEKIILSRLLRATKKTATQFSFRCRAKRN